MRRSCLLISKPAIICYIVIDRRKWATSSAGRALRSQCRGRGFDPPVVHQLPPVSSPHTVASLLRRKSDAPWNLAGDGGCQAQWDGPSPFVVCHDQTKTDDKRRCRGRDASCLAPPARIRT